MAAFTLATAQTDAISPHGPQTPSAARDSDCLA